MKKFIVILCAVLCVVALLPVYLFIFRYHKSEQKGETPNGKNDP